MKRWIYAVASLLLIGSVLVSSVACKKDDNRVIGSPEPGKNYTVSDGRLYYLSLDLSEYVTISAYTGLTAVMDPDRVSEAVSLQLKDIAKAYASVSATKTVAENDIVVCNYIVYVNGEKIVERSGEQIEAVPNGYADIPGFAEGLIGAKPGVVKRITVVLPEDFADSALAGKQAVFDVTVNYVFTYELSDAVIVSYTGGKYRTVAEYRDVLYQQQYWGMAQEAIFLKIMENTSVLTHNSEAETYYYRELVKEVERESGISYQEYLEATGSTDQEFRDSAKRSYEYNLVLYRIVQLEGFEVYQKEYDLKFEEYVQKYIADVEAQSGAGSVTRKDAEALVEANRELVISGCLEDKVFQFLLSKNSVLECK